MKHCNIHNSLIFTTHYTHPRIAQVIGEDEGTACGRSDSAAENKKFLFVFNSIVCACRNAAAGRDWFVISKITGLVCNF